LSPSAIKAVELYKHYHLGDELIKALDGVSLDVREGEFVAIMGPSGSGKSTLMHLLGLLDLADKGEVFIEGKSTKDLNDDELTALRRDKLGFIFQNFELIPSLNAKENILLPAEVAKQKPAGEKRLEKLAEQLSINDRLEHKPNQLSGGQRQRIAIARALINDPAVILADEPTGNLDSKTSQEVLKVLREGVDKYNWTVVMVTHDLTAAKFADRIINFRDGKIVEENE